MPIDPIDPVAVAMISACIAVVFAIANAPSYLTTRTYIINRLSELIELIRLLQQKLRGKK